MSNMIEIVTGRSDGLATAAQLLHDFNLEYEEPSPPPEEMAGRLAELVETDQVMVLLARR